MKRPESPCKFIKTTTQMESQAHNSNNTSSTEKKESNDSYYDSLRKKVDDYLKRTKELDKTGPHPLNGKIK